MLAAPANAQATRTWVSGVGDDVNPCSRTAPCKTFAGAISKTATGGEINCLDPGGFGAVTITKSMTIDCAGTMGSILASAVNGVNVNNTASSPGTAIVVHLRNLSINGSGTTLGLDGVRFISTFGELHLHNVQIFDFSSNGVEFAPTTGVGELYVVDSTITNVGSDGILVKPTGTGTAKGALTRVQVNANNTGVFVNSETSGVAGVRITAKDVVASGAAGGGFVAKSAAAGGRPASLVLDQSVSASNGNGLVVDGATAGIVINSSMITDNGTAIVTSNGGGVGSRGNNTSSGNTAAGTAPTPVGAF
jgi:hypothetical protein